VTARPRRAGLVVSVVAVVLAAAGGLGTWWLTHRTERVTTAAPTAPTLPTARPAPAVVPRCTPEPSLAQAPAPSPPDLAAALQRFVSDPLVAPHQVSVSIWIDGYGEVVTHEPDLRLVPASNQKLLTAMTALEVLGADRRLTTQLLVTAAGQLVVRGHHDPTMRTVGPHSLAALADAARAAGVVEVLGGLVVDESADDGARRAAGWQDWQIPTYTGPLSALMVDDNRWRRDPAFLADPALENARHLRDQLAVRGVRIVGDVSYGSAAPDARIVATLESAPVAELVHQMLLSSTTRPQTSCSRRPAPRRPVSGRSPRAPRPAASRSRRSASPCPASTTTAPG
jgi:serine-type D-Ala-D-Ala carboxypeptidase/endopeptidase (penicillin-binding protein 4)